MLDGDHLPVVSGEARYQHLPDSLIAQNHHTYVTNGWVDATGPCEQCAPYYTEGSDSSGNYVETPHPWLC